MITKQYITLKLCICYILHIIKPEIATLPDILAIYNILLLLKHGSDDGSATPASDEHRFFPFSVSVKKSSKALN